MGACVMAGIFDLKKGAFDSTEAALLFEAYDIALHGLRASHSVDRLVIGRLARSIVKVVRTEPDCLKNDGTIDPPRLAQRAILRMLQMSAPKVGIDVGEDAAPRLIDRLKRKEKAPEAIVPPVESAGQVMLRLFERTPFAKL